LIDTLEQSGLIPAPRRHSLHYIDLLTLEPSPSIVSLQLELKVGTHDVDGYPLQLRIECLAVLLSPPLPKAPARLPRALTVPDVVHYRPGNASFEITTGSPPSPVNDLLVDNYRLRTELGRKRIELRRAYILGGGKLLTQGEILGEIRHNQGEPDNA